MFDLIISQHAVTWQVPLNDDGSLPSTITFGSSVYSASELKIANQTDDEMQPYLNSLYQLFWEEFVVLMERIRFLY